jgi:hypothetical protein
MPIIVAVAQSSSLRLNAGRWPGAAGIASASERKKTFLKADLPFDFGLASPFIAIVVLRNGGLSRCVTIATEMASRLANTMSNRTPVGGIL